MEILLSTQDCCMRRIHLFRIPMWLFAIFMAYTAVQAQQPSLFVQVRNRQFTIAGKPYYFIGANYWYAALEASRDSGRIRIRKELDFLQHHGVNNIRVLAGAEGQGIISGMPRVEPALQLAPGVFSEAVLEGMDFLLDELGRRQMKAVIYFSNNWEWSGGFLQYLNWNGLINDSVIRRKLSWDEMRDYVSRFYTCDNCVKQYEAQARLLVKRVNSINKIKYADDPAIMAWEIANEPRPMRPSANEAYKKFLARVSASIKQWDTNHLLTIGNEGEMGTEQLELFRQIHADANIDYTTIHIWPKNWGWFKDTAIGARFDEVLGNTNAYISKHAAVAKELAKPLVIEEFGLPRDGHSFSASSSTSYRDRYYAQVCSMVVADAAAKGIIGGVNFWAFSGSGRPSHQQLLWKNGDDVLGDPPVEEQGLNSVFDSDAGTWEIIASFASQLMKGK